MNRIIKLALVVLLSLSMVSCSEANKTKEDTGEADKTALAERRISLNEESPLVLSIIDSGDKYTLLSTDNDRKILHQSTLNLSADGKSEQSALIEIARAESDQFIFAAAVSPENSIVYSCASKDGTTMYYLVDSEGKTDEIDVEGNSIIGFIDSNSLIISNQSRSLMRFSLGSKKIEATYQLNRGQFLVSYTVVEDKLIVLTNEAVDGLLVYSTKAFDLESGEELNTLFELTQAIDSVLPKDKMIDAEVSPVLSRNAETKEIYVVSQGLVYAVSKNYKISLWANGEDTNLSNKSMRPVMVLPGDNGFITLYQSLDMASMGSTSLYSYSPGKPKAEETLTIYMLEDNLEIRQAVSAYREENQNVEVLLRVGLPKETTLTAEDAIKQLNLDILAGNAPDVIVLDGFSVNQFQKEKLLVDLSDVIDRLESADAEYFGNVLSCYKDESGCYAIPTRFTIPSIIANKDLLSQIKSMEDLAKIVESYRGQKQTFLGLNCDLAVLYTADYGNIIQGDSISKEELSRFFEQSKRMVSVSGEAFELNKELISDLTMDAIDLALWGFTNGQSFGMTGNALLETSVGEPSADLAQIGSVNSVRNFPLISLTINNTDNDLAFGLLKFTNRQVFSLSTVLGVSSSCTNLDLAKQFIEFTLSNEQQKSDQGLGLPVNRIAFKETLERVSSEGVEVWPGGEISYANGPLNDEEILNYLELVDSVEVACITDRVITDLVKTELESYLRGQKTLDEAVEAAFQKITLYLLE